MSMDVDAMIDQSNQELKEYANKRIPLPGKSLSEKDEDLLKKVSLIATAVKVDGPPILAPDVSVVIVIMPTDQRVIYYRGAVPP